jgi:NAD(P)-dependent dehydrogenase (short-subunit alcohol dehydrogenase family)
MTPPGPILVTGASTGIGEDIARTLTSQGHRVFATARKDADLEALAAIPGVTPIRLDVRVSAQVRDAIQTVGRGGQGLYGLVNNAGIGELGLCSTWKDEELAPHGVGVSIVQPGGVATTIGRNSISGTILQLRRAEPPFKEEAEAILESFEGPSEPSEEEAEESETNRKPSPPAIVTHAVVDALFSSRPKLRYMVGTSWEGDRVLRALVERLLDENDCPSQGYSRERLIALLDRSIAARERVNA